MNQAPYYPRLPWLKLALLWLGWAILILGYQEFAATRMAPDRPDYARDWTSRYTEANSNQGKPYLLEPFMNRQVAWDSEYYLSIAVAGYEDPLMRRIETPEGPVSQNYAFFPLYPLLARLFIPWLIMIDPSPIGQAALGAVIVSLLGTLAGLVALYDLARGMLGEEGAWRASFYLLIFPAAFFFAQVYTEGLFIGLAFSSLALIRRGYFGWASALAVLAFFTRLVGLALVIPLGITWLRTAWPGLKSGRFQPSRKLMLDGLCVLLPVAVYLAWNASPMAHNFHLVDENWFGRKALDLPASAWAWADAWRLLNSGHPHARALHSLEFASILLALVASLWALRRDPGLALFCLAIILIPALSGSFQSNIRYMGVIPSVYLFLGQQGRRPVFDRLWTLLSILLLGMQAFLYTYDMWVA